MDQASSKDPVRQPESEPNHGGAPAWIFWGFCTLAVYVLSVGPAAKIHDKFPATGPALETVYKPISLLIDASPPADRFFTWYIEEIWKAQE